MRLNSRCLVPLAALLLLPLGGCFVAVPLGGGVLVGAAAGAATTPRTPYSVVGHQRPGAALQIEFPVPVELVAISTNGRDTTRIPDATRVIGRVRASAPDSCWLRLTEVRRSGGTSVAWSRDAAPVAMVPLANSRVQLIAANASSIERTLVGGAVGFLAVLGWFYWSCRHNGCYSGT